MQSVKLQKKWPTAYISHVDEDGLMYVTFSSDMKIPEHPGEIENSTVLINGTLWPILDI
jgi:hypothetical protein